MAVSSTAMTGWADGSLAMMVGMKPSGACQTRARDWAARVSASPIDERSLIFSPIYRAYVEAALSLNQLTFAIVVSDAMIARMIEPHIEQALAQAIHNAPAIDRCCADLTPAKQFVVYGGTERFPLNTATEAIGLAEMSNLVRVGGVEPPRD